MLAGVTIVDPETTWIEAGRRARARRDDPSVHGAAAARRQVARGAGRRPARGRRRRRDRPRGDRRAVLLPSPRNGPRSAARRPAHSWRSRTRTSAQRTKVPHLSYIGDADVGEGTNIGAGNITANLRTALRRSPKSRTKIGRNVKTGVRQFVRCSGRRLATMLGSRRDPSSPKNVPPDSLAIARARQENKEGYVASKRRRLSWPSSRVSRPRR